MVAARGERALTATPPTSDYFSCLRRRRRLPNAVAHGSERRNQHPLMDLFTAERFLDWQRLRPQFALPPTMSEYWVSKKKYFCKYCDVYIADDAPSRNQHEGGMRHQGNKERYVRNLYKTAERKKKDDEEEAREMKRIEAVSSPFRVLV
jgi:hypothetical protein